MIRQNQSVILLNFEKIGFLFFCTINLSSTFFLLAVVSFSIKSKDDTTPTTLKAALPMEHSSDEEVQQTKPINNKTAQNACSSSKDPLLPPNLQQSNLQQQAPSIVATQKTNDGCAITPLSVDIDQSDSFIRDTILEQQNLDERKQVKRAEDKVRDRLAQLAREKLGILSKEKQLQLERKRRAMAFLNQINCKHFHHSYI